MKKRRKYRSGLGALVVGTVGAEVIGSALPGTAGVPVRAVSSGLSGFIAPTTAVTGAGMVVKKLRKFPKIKKLKGGKKKR